MHDDDDSHPSTIPRAPTAPHKSPTHSLNLIAHRRRENTDCTLRGGGRNRNVAHLTVNDINNFPLGDTCRRV
eukprot:scaffold61224_cov36-Tisochrysis_lutea.AAC.3